VLDHDAVVAFMPTRALDTMLPLVLGTTRPPRSIGDVDDVPAMIRREHLLPSTFGLVDTRRLAVLAPSAKDADALARHPAYSVEELRLRGERAADCRGAVRLVAGDGDGWRVDDAADLLGNDGKELVRLDALRHERGNAAQGRLLERAVTTLFQVRSDLGPSGG